MAVGDVSTLRVVGRYQQQNIVNVLHYLHNEQAAPENEVLGGIIDLWDTAMRILWQGRHVDTYTLVGIKAFRKTGAAKTPAFKLITAAGTVVGTEVPSPVCRTITLYTASAKFRRRGRLMLSGGEDAMFSVTDGSVTATEITALETMAATLVTPLVGLAGNFSLCIPPNTTDPVEEITDYAGRPTPSVIRSRRIRQFLVG